MSVEVAITFATRAHMGQLDLSGVPYIYHPLRVMEAVRRLGEEYARVAVLHDVVEDTDFSLEAVARAVQLTDDETAALDLVTRAPEGDSARITYTDFIIRIGADRSGAGDIARAVKLADIYDNLGRLTPGLKGMEKRYTKALEILDPNAT